MFAGTSSSTVAPESSFSDSQYLLITSTAIALATSPCASPPIPSDRMKRFRASTMRKESSLLVRTRPTSDKPLLTICTASPSSLAVNTTGTPGAHPGLSVPSTLADTLLLGKALHPTDYLSIPNTYPRVNLQEYSNSIGAWQARAAAQGGLMAFCASENSSTISVCPSLRFP